MVWSTVTLADLHLCLCPVGGAGRHEEVASVGGMKAPRERRLIGLWDVITG